MLSVTAPSVTKSIYLDTSIQDTRFSFTYSRDVTVEVTMEDDSADVVLTNQPAQKRVIADINGTVVSTLVLLSIFLVCKLNCTIDCG